MNEKIRFLRGKSIVLVAMVILAMVAQITMPALSNAIYANGAEVAPRKGGAQRINADNLVWTPVSKENPLGGADDFNAFLFDEFKNFHETGGPVAARKFDNVRIVTFREGGPIDTNRYGDFPIPKYNIGILGKEHSGIETKIANGDAIISTDSSIAFNDNGGNLFDRSDKIDNFFEEAYKDLKKLQNDLWNKEGKLPEADLSGWYSNLICDSDDGINVFEINNNHSGSINFVADSDDTIIIKLSRDNLKDITYFLNGTAMNTENTDNIVNRVIWVLDPEIKEFNGHNSHILGSFLAPDANVRFTGNGSLDGTTIANSIDGGGTSTELHYTGMFMGKLVNLLGPENPEDPDEPGGGTVTPEDPDEPGGGTVTPEDPDEPGGGTVTPEDPDEPGGGTVKPEDPDKPGGGTVKPEDPDEPGGGTVKPEDPDKPGGGTVKPEDPDEPGGGTVKPEDPDEPGGGTVKPEDPDKPGGGTVKPEDPDKPGGGTVKPEDPDKPGGGTGKPSIPKEPIEPDKPVEPIIPELPENPTINVENPSLPNETVDHKPDKNDQLDHVPKTGDIGYMNGWLLLGLLFWGMVPWTTKKVS